MTTLYRDAHDKLDQGTREGIAAHRPDQRAAAKAQVADDRPAPDHTLTREASATGS